MEDGSLTTWASLPEPHSLTEPVEVAVEAGDVAEVDAAETALARAATAGSGPLRVCKGRHHKATAGRA